MTDRELLEMAAKAASLIIVGDVDRMIAQPDHRTGGFVIRNEMGGDSCWNPLTDDGDALRLAVSMGMRVGVGQVDWVGGEYIGTFVEDEDKMAATRRAIVMAAAEIGKAMPS